MPSWVGKISFRGQTLYFRGIKVRACKYQDGMIIEISVYEMQQAQSYLKYTDYIFNKLYPRNHYIPTALEIFRQLDYAIRKILKTKQTDESKYWWNTKEYLPNCIRQSPTDSKIYRIALSTDVLSILSKLSIDVDPEFKILQTRLKKQKWPNPAVFYKLLQATTGREIMDEFLEDRERFIKHPWYTVFPNIFTMVDLTKWETELNEILTAFANDRRSTVKKIEKIIWGEKK